MSNTEAFEILANETIIIFSQIVKERKQFNIETLSDMFSRSAGVKKLLNNERKVSDKDEVKNLKEKLREYNMKVARVKSDMSRKMRFFQRLIKNLTLVIDIDKKMKIKSFLEEIIAELTTPESQNEEMLKYNMNELERLVSNLSHKTEDGKKKSFFSGIFPSEKTSQPQDSTDIEPVIKKLLSTIVMRFQLDRLEFNNRLDILVGKINREGLSAPEEIKSEICEVIGTFKEILVGEKEDLYKLMEEIITRLIDTEKELAIAFSSTQANSEKYNREFQRTFAEELEDIEKSFQKTSIDEIKTLVFHKINNIKKVLKEKKDMDDRLSGEIMEYINSLQKDLSKNEEEMKKIRDMAEMDPLTGIYNRAAFQTKLKEEFGRFMKSQEPWSIIFFDVDNFKEINRDYTYENGDRILQTLAKVTGEKIPQKYIFARYGGGEFAIILPGADLYKSRELSEYIRKLVLDIEFSHLEERVPVTISVGTAEFDREKTPLQILQVSHKALQQAKKKGKNQVMSFK